MTMGLRTWVARAIGAAIAAVAIVASAPPVGAVSASACTARSGVTVIVDFAAFHFGIERGCAPGHPSSALAALQSAGFATAGTSQYGDAFVCRIDDRPSSANESCTKTPPATASWSFYWARPTDNDWTYSTTGVTSYQPPSGSLVGFAFGHFATPAIGPAAVLGAPTVTLTTAVHQPAVAPVTPATATPRTTTSATSPSTATTAKAAHSTAPARTPAGSSTTATVHVVERTAADVTHHPAGSPRAALVAVAVVAAVSVGGWVTVRARRRRPA
jgi:hypothetical protein